MDEFPEPTLVQAGPFQLAVYEKGQPSGTKPSIVLVHGWPEIAYSWKAQINAFAAAGYHILALDLKGFGHSDCPQDKRHYDILHLSQDLVWILDAYSIEKAVFCGHDWGGAIIWSMGVLHPDRVAGLIGVCTPHLPTPPIAPLRIIEKRFGPSHYFIEFQKQGLAEKVFAAREEKFFSLMFRKPPPRHLWPDLIPQIYDLLGRLKNGPDPDLSHLMIPKHELQHFVRAYQRSGFHGGVNLYRNLDRNWEIMRERDLQIKAPCLWVGAELDIFLPPEASEKMDDLIPDLTRTIIDDCGHWVMWEKPAELNKIVLTWLRQKFNPQ